MSRHGARPHYASTITGWKHLARFSTTVGCMHLRNIPRICYIIWYSIGVSVKIKGERKLERKRKRGQTRIFGLSGTLKRARW